MQNKVVFVEKTPYDFPAKRLAYSLAIQKVSDLLVIVEDKCDLEPFLEFKSSYKTEVFDKEKHENPYYNAIICDTGVIFPQNSLSQLFKQPIFTCKTQLIDPETLDLLDSYGSNLVPQMIKKFIPQEISRVYRSELSEEIEINIYAHPYPKEPETENSL